MATRDFVVKNGLDVTEVAIIRDTTDSSSKDTGALIVEGGAGIEKNLNVGVNLGVGGAATITGNTTLTGDLAVNGGDITTNQTTFNLVETTATTLNIGGASTTLNLGASSGTTTVRNNLNVNGDLEVDGGDLTSGSSSFNLINTTATTLNIGGAATSLTLGATTGTLTVRNTQTVFSSTDSIKLPVGTTAQRDQTPEAGQIRYNSEISTFEGYGPGGAWGSLGGVKDVDGNTYIIPETAPGANNNRLDFYANGTFAMSLNSSTLDVRSGTTLVVSNSTEASSTTTGSVQIAGGVGIAKRLYAASIENTPIGTSVRNTALFSTLGVNGQVTFNAGTASTTTGTGSLVVTGGIGLSGAINAGASSTLAGLSSTSTTTLSPANASVTISPTGTGSVTISPATTGNINNMNIGATTAGTGRFSSVNVTSGNITIASPFGLLGGTVTGGNQRIWAYDASNTGFGIYYTEGATDSLRIDVSGNAETGTPDVLIIPNGIQINGNTTWHAGNDGTGSGLDADLLDGLQLNSTTTNNQVNTVVRTDSSGYANFGWINTISGDAGTSAIDRVYASFDGYIRYYTPSNFRQVLDVPTRSGGNATGTWAISISGNAATANSTPNPTFSGDAINKASIATRTDSGFYEHDTAATADGWPVNGSWHHLIACTHSNDSNYYSMQIAGDFYTNTIYFRNVNNNGNTAWSTFIHSGNYTSYSPTLTGGGASGTWGINISGNAATASNTSSISSAVSGSYTWTGVQYFQSNLGATSGSLSSPPLQVYATGGNSAFMSFHRGGSYAVNMGLDSDNVLRIGGWSASANRLQLDMSGNLTIAGTFTEQSSIRYKDNVQPIDGALEKVLQLQGVTYDKKDGSSKSEPGLIAEEVYKIIPALVTRDTEGEIDGIHYTKITAYLIECIKELNAKIERLEGKTNG